MIASDSSPEPTSALIAKLSNMVYQFSSPDDITALKDNFFSKWQLQFGHIAVRQNSAFAKVGILCHSITNEKAELILESGNLRIVAFGEIALK
ncbi:hypothetical protein KIN20_015158 [Parelaphostrongylus tenuis]|uniref:Uncharacterized protein n=1 Tax=Parelaphostrongylus tenuis TaxID=148309 RepID=A0AAD5MJ42_PARTN|nr:hypothetical protein KIN20_015158 [Parelaphostrongylus tenuis]